jgi:hypothetical protein
MLDLRTRSALPNGRRVSGEPCERSERPERMRGRRVRCNAMLGRRIRLRRAAEKETAEPRWSEFHFARPICFMNSWLSQKSHSWSIFPFFQ